MDGFITLHRKIIDWEWYSDTSTRSVFIDLLLNASHNEYRWHGMNIKRGQVISGYPSCAKRLGISIQSVRTAIKHLKSTGEVTVKVTNRFSLITIVKYDDYQANKIKSTHKSTVQLTVNQQSTNSQLTTTNNVNNVNNENKNSRAYIFSKQFFVSLWNSERLNCYKITPLMVRKCYETIGDYVVSTNKQPYKDMPATIRNWLSKDIDNGKIEKLIPGEVQGFRDTQLRNIDLYLLNHPQNENTP